MIFLLGLIYILSPGSAKVNDFTPLPDFLKSDEPGDTYQVPNVTAYFSQSDRAEITNFYRQELSKKYFWGGLIPPISLNYPPKAAQTLVRDQLYVTFLEEYVYPLKGSIFVAGYEPYIDNELLGRNHTFIGDHIHIKGNYYKSKTTLRYYPADLFNSLVVYLGIWLSGTSLWLLIKRLKR